MRLRRVLVLVLAVSVLLTAGDGDGSPTASLVGDAADHFPDVVDVVATYDDTSDTWAFDVTMTSPYDSPDRYADGWRVIGPDGTVYGTHLLAHDHADEQPFTRRQSDVTIPETVDEITVEGRDQVNGFGGRPMTITLRR